MRRRVLVAAAALLAAAVAVVAAVLILTESSKPPEPSAFYDAPPAATLRSARAGAVLRSEPMDHVPDGARAWRVLYRSVREDGSPGAFSGIIVVPGARAPDGGRDVVALTPGTLGVASRCGLSTRPADEIFPVLHGLAGTLAVGRVLVVPDYEGLGTRGPHPYLVGDSEARATLDLVRAAGNFRPAGAGSRFAVWGESQGGHAALFTGQFAASYAPGLTLVGVAAAAPATDLAELLRANRDTTVGRILSAYALGSWSRVYPGLKLSGVERPVAIPAVRSLQSICLGDAGGVRAAAVNALALTPLYLRSDPWDTEPWKGLLARNSPGGADIPAPVLVTQGDADALVRPAITAAAVRRLCARGERVRSVVYPGVTHAQAGSASVADVDRWIAARFAGDPAPSTCPD